MFCILYFLARSDLIHARSVLQASGTDGSCTPSVCILYCSSYLNCYTVSGLLDLLLLRLQLLPLLNASRSLGRTLLLCYIGYYVSFNLHRNPDKDTAALIVGKELRVFKQDNSWPSMAKPSAQKAPSVYLYIPNIIGYFRIIINFYAFAVCYTNRPLFAILYFVSFFFDGLDGWFARRFNQASTFGAVLDMVTDRVSTACLLALLSQFYRPGLVFLILLGLDITSHWFQMYSSFLSGKTSHKDVKDTCYWLLKLYYGYRPFMAFCCVASEVLYIILFLFAEEKSTSLLSVCRGILKQESPLIVFVFISTLVGWALKQVINVIQMKTAADACVVFDLKRGK